MAIRYVVTGGLLILFGQGAKALLREDAGTMSAWIKRY
jgi:hypothetical protein